MRHGNSVPISVIQFGPVVRVRRDYYQSTQYAEFYTRLTGLFEEVSITAGYLLPDEPGAALSNEASLSIPGATLRTFRGNTSATGVLVFLANYGSAVPVVIWSVLTAERVLIFGPCILGTVALWTCYLMKKPFGFYWANDWRTENRYRLGTSRWRRVTNRMNEHFVQALTARAVRKAAFVITPSYEIANRLAEWGGRVEMAIPLLKIAGVIGEPRASCRMLDGQLRILYVGELRGPKGVDVLLDAFTELTGSLGEVGKGAHLTLVGDGEMKLRVSEIVRERGLEASVAIRGHIADAQRLAEEYLAADIFVLPSRSEGFPRVLYEAMAAGLPVVATRVGGIPTLLRDGVDALLVAVGEPGAIAEAVYRLATDQELYSRISLNGLAVFRQRVVERSAMGRSLANQVAELFDLADGCGLSPDSV